MKCPYCTSEIDESAIVCPMCSRDLFLVRKLQARIGELEATVSALEVRVGRGEAADIPAPAIPQPPEPRPAARVLEAAALWLAPLSLLLVAHALITIAYDLNNILLRIVSLLLPLPFAYALTSRRDRPVAPWLAVAFASALVAVLGMSAITAWVDHVPVLPQDRREWKEFIEYAASVGFSAVAGLILGRMAWQRQQAARATVEMQGIVLRIAQLLNSGQQSVEKVQGTVKKLNDLGGSLTAAAASAASAYMGLQGFLGG